MNEALALSKLATKLLRDLQDVSDCVDDDSAVYHQSIELILESFSSVEYLISQRTAASPEEPDEHQPERPIDDDDPVN